VRWLALSAICVSFGGEGTRIQDATISEELYAGRPAFITGRFNGAIGVKVLVTARANGLPVSFQVLVKQVSANTGAILRKLWARTQMTQLARRQLRGEWVDAVAACRSLALEYGLASPFTSACGAGCGSGGGAPTPPGRAVPRGRGCF